MKNDTRTSNDIERDIVDERVQLRGTINELQNKFSVEAIVNDVGQIFREQGRDLGRTISHTVSANPAAVVMVGVGLAWLFLGQDRKSANAMERQSGRLSRALTDQRTDDGPFYDEDRAWYGDGQTSRDRSFPGQNSESWGHLSDTDDAAHGVLGSVRDGASAAAGAVSDAAGSLGKSARRLTERLSSGTEDFSDEARNRVVSARRAAHDARRGSEAAMNRASKAAIGFFEDQPLVVGAMAVALGAAIGSVLPNSRIEDDTMGDSSDQLFEDAQAVFREERDKALAVARTVVADVQDEIGEMGSELGSELAGLLPEGKKVGDVIVDQAADAASRVFTGAKSAAEEEGLGRRES